MIEACITYGIRHFDRNDHIIRGLKPLLHIRCVVIAPLHMCEDRQEHVRVCVRACVCVCIKCVCAPNRTHGKHIVLIDPGSARMKA